MDLVSGIGPVRGAGLLPGPRPAAAAGAEPPRQTFEQVLASLPGGGERPPATLSETQRLAWAAREMEAFFLQQMWKAARRGLPESDLFPRDRGSRMFEDMLDEERSRQMAGSGKLGLAKIVYEQMLPYAEAKRDGGQ